jgi:DNA polymerase-3 subunit epsilon
VLLHEHNRDSEHSERPRRHYHLLNHWSYQGSFANRRSALAAARRAPSLVFDRDAYRIALSALRNGECEIIDARGGAEVDNPLHRSAA